MPYSKNDLRDLYDGILPWERTFEIMSKPKDDDRFDKYVAILQERVSYTERILMPLGNHLNVVDKDGERIVKCDCGHEFGDWRRNWKLNALVFSRDDTAKLEEIYPGLRARARITSHFRIPSSRHLRPLLNREFLDVAQTTPVDSLNRRDRIWRKSGREFWEVILARTLKCPNADLCEVREFTCPGCGSLLKVEAVPVGYPIIFDALPDIDAFYREWLGRPLPEEKDFKDTTHEVTKQWRDEHHGRIRGAVP